MTGIEKNLVDRLKSGLLVIEKLRTDNEQLERSLSEPIAIVGMGCRLPPGANTPEAFWEQLHAGADAIGEIPRERWNVDDYYDPNPDAAGKSYTRYGAFLRHLDRFDPRFFGIAPREAHAMDPQQRLLLEVAWETLENAGLAPGSLRGTKTGVFVGSMGNEYATQAIHAGGMRSIEAYTGTGGAGSFLAGRLSYQLGLQGPSLPVDTACSSSLVAVHLACQSLRKRECDLALAGGVNVILTPDMMVLMSKLRALAVDGRCKTFDAAADGYGRGEGCGLLALRRLSDALAAGDMIAAVVRGSAFNHDGPSGALTVPNAQAQQDVIRQALREGRVDPRDISYVEAHGTGTVLGDPIELRALWSVLGPGRSAEQVLTVGSVKTNVGHLEGAAGIAGMIKVVLALQHGEIPRHLHLKTLNPHIAREQLPIHIPVEPVPWPAGKSARRAGISSFGISGMNAHIVVEEAPVVAHPVDPNGSAPKDRGVHVLAFSARDKTALKELAQRYRTWLEDHPEADLADVCFTAGTGRSHFEHRAAVVADSCALASTKLSALVSGEGLPSHSASQDARQVAFLFCDDAALDLTGMHTLLALQPVFRNAVERCSDLLGENLRPTLREVLLDDGGLLTQPVHRRVSQFAVQYALAELLGSWGLRPTVVTGAGLGEFASACAAGAVSLEDALRLVLHRERADFETWSQTVATRALGVSLVEGLTGRLVAEGQLLPRDFWYRPAGSRRFSPNLRALAELGCTAAVIFGADTERFATSGGSLDSVGSRNDGLLCIPALSAERSAMQQLTEVVAALYVHGVTPDFAAFDRPWRRRKLALPTYPFQRQHYWVEQWSGSRQAEVGIPHPLWGSKQGLATGEEVYARELSLPQQPYLGDHRLFGQVVMPGAWSIAGALAVTGAPAVVRRLRFLHALVLGEVSSRRLQVVIDGAGADGERHFRVFSARSAAGSWTLHAEGMLQAPTAGVSVESGPTPASWCAGLVECFPADLYASLFGRGIGHGPSFRCVRNLWAGNGEAVGELVLPETAPLDVDLPIHPVLLDGSLQIVAAALGSDANGTYVPVSLDRVELKDGVGHHFYCRATLRPATNSAEHTADLKWADKTGRVLGSIDGLVVQCVRPESFLKIEQASAGDCLYEVVWKAQPLPAANLAEDCLQQPEELTELMAEPNAAWATATGNVSYAALTMHLDTLSALYSLQALLRLGWRPEAGQRVTATNLRARLGIATRHERLLGRLLELLAIQGWLHRDDAGWIVERLPSMVSATELHTELLARYPACRLELGLLERCGSRLAEALHGDVEPLDLLFGGPGEAQAGRLYGASPTAEVFNALVGAVVGRAAASVPAGRRLRVLEVGAGTGGTTAAVLPVLPAERSDYTFTDISAGFFPAAEEQFAAYPFVRYLPFDLERDPTAQGLAAQSYDVVVAANVVHATRDVARSVAHLRRLLAPGGLLVLLEALQPQGWLDLTFGLLPGWWQFADGWRSDYPLLGGERWRRLLQEQGFRDARVLTLAQEPALQGVIVAQAAAEQDAGAAGGTWLILDDAAGLGTRLAELLRQRGQRCLERSAADLGEAAELQRWLDEVLPDQAAFQGVVHLGSLDDNSVNTATAWQQEIARNCGSVLNLVQALVRRQAKPARGLWLVTRGAQATEDGAGVASLGQSPMWGLGKVVALEHPELGCRCLDLDPTPDPAEVEHLLDQLLAADAENQIALRAGERRVARMRRWPPTERLSVPQGEYQLQSGTRGLLEDLHLRALPRREPGTGEIAVRVRSAGLNFRDVLYALGLVLGEAEAPMGGEVAGEVAAVGEGVTQFRIGDAVFGLAPGSLASQVVVPASYLVSKPETLSYTQAAGVPIAFCTAWLAWSHAGLRAGERVLIHAASGGTGLAAIQLAQRLGAEVFATASPPKQDYLRTLGVRHVFNSRTLDFAAQVREATGGQGVDVVLNSLTSGDFIASTLSTLALGGRFIEIGKRDVWSVEKVAAKRPDVRYEVLALDGLMRSQPEEVVKVLRQVAAGFARRELAPMRQRVYPVAETPAALRLMQEAKHLGKIVLRVPGPVTGFVGTGSFLVTGGLSGLGLATARWLVQQGVRHLALMGRRPPDATAEATLAELRAAGCALLVLEGDVTQESDVRRVLTEVAVTMPRLRGVFHCAGVLDDGALVNQTWDRFAPVLGPKVQGAWHLHQLTQDCDLDCFVMFSSMVSVLGSAGQANHAAANAFLDGLAHTRRSAGQAALSINWGAWSHIGAAATAGVSGRLRLAGIGTITPEMGLAVLEQLLRAAPVQVGVLPIDWARMRARARERVPPLLEDLLGQRSPANPTATTAPVGDVLRRLEMTMPEERPELLRRHLAGELARVLRLDPAQPLDPQRGFFDLGMDSLMAVELRNRLQTQLGSAHVLTSTVIFDHPTIASLSEHLGQVMFNDLGFEDNAAQRVQPAADVRLSERLDQLSEDEIAQALDSKLAKYAKGI